VVAAETSVVREQFRRNRVGWLPGEARFEEVTSICERNGSDDVRVARDEAERALFWKTRKAAFPAMGRISPNYFVQDGVIPRTKLPEVLEAIDAGDTGATIDVVVNGDATYEGDETLSVALSDPSSAVLVDGAAVGTIRTVVVCPPTPTSEAIATEIKAQLDQLVSRRDASRSGSSQIRMLYSPAPNTWISCAIRTDSATPDACDIDARDTAFIARQCTRPLRDPRP
jgi:FAD/FMN-containing dehydrogenase